MMRSTLTRLHLLDRSRVSRQLLVTGLWVAMGVASASQLGAAPLVFTDSGATPADIADTVGAYRTALGILNPNVAGSFGSGRREINWDGVPDAFASPNPLPANFFNANSPRGVVFSTPGTGFQVSANAAVAAVKFGNIDAVNSLEFQTFTAQRLFTAIDSTVTDVSFFIPGSATPAAVHGFGAVFTGVDVADVTSIQYFGTRDQLLATVDVPAGRAGSLSFAGLWFDDTTQITRVRLTSGQVPIGATGGDRVVMDDFIYAEPLEVVPEPATLSLLGATVLLLGARRRRA